MPEDIELTGWEQLLGDSPPADQTSSDEPERQTSRKTLVVVTASNDEREFEENEALDKFNPEQGVAAELLRGSSVEARIARRIVWAHRPTTKNGVFKANLAFARSCRLADLDLQQALELDAVRINAATHWEGRQRFAVRNRSYIETAYTKCESNTCTPMPMRSYFVVHGEPYQWFCSGPPDEEERHSYEALLQHFAIEYIRYAQAFPSVTEVYFSYRDMEAVSGIHRMQCQRMVDRWTDENCGIRLESRGRSGAEGGKANGYIYVDPSHSIP